MHFGDEQQPMAAVARDQVYSIEISADLFGARAEQAGSWTDS